jgi:hypothetical protein
VAFVRWRKNCAELLTTVYQDGRSRQVLLTVLSGYTVPLPLRAEVARRFPGIDVDWHAVERALAKGPKERPAPVQHMTWAEADSLLRELAETIATKRGWAQDADTLLRAAEVLTAWRAAGVPPDPPSEGPCLSSADQGCHAPRGPPWTSKGPLLVMPNPCRTKLPFDQRRPEDLPGNSSHIP